MVTRAGSAKQAPTRSRESRVGSVVVAPTVGLTFGFGFANQLSDLPGARTMASDNVDEIQKQLQSRETRVTNNGSFLPKGSVP
jgi:hypothetical protein